MSALEINTTIPQMEDPDIPEYLQRILHDTGFNLTGMDPTDIKNLADSFKKGVDDFHSSTQRVLREEE